jgi:hypothetical protein
MNMSRPVSVSFRRVKSTTPKLSLFDADPEVIEEITATRALSQEDNSAESATNTATKTDAADSTDASV